MSRKLKVGLELHTQLKTAKKLFSLSNNITSNLTVKPNTQTSFFDVSLPGTQPKLNREPLLFALKLATALNCDINPISSFDRKHYFYGDQPLGYQITQHYKPIATNGSIQLSKKFDGLATDKLIRIEQLQIEQDTARSLYRSNATTGSKQSLIDFNRSNIPLIEMVTKPDFETIEEIRSFIKKYQATVVDLGVCSGELETGAIRVDVNVSVDDHSRCEIKNVPTISGIISAIKYEYKRQCQVLANGESNEVETRGWDGKMTYKLRSKEDSIDYRYFPDPELPLIKLNVDDISNKIKDILPDSVDVKLSELMEGEYQLKLRDANILISDYELLTYYKELYKKCELQGLKNPINWITHELLGCLTKSNLKFDKELMDLNKFTELLIAINNKRLSAANGKVLLMHLINNKQDQRLSIDQLIEDFEIGLDGEVDQMEVKSFVDKVIEENENVVKEIISKKKIGKLNYLIGLCCRASGGKIEARVFEIKLKEKLNI